MLEMAEAKAKSIEHVARKLDIDTHQIYKMQTALEQAHAIGKTTGSISLGRTPFPLFARSRSEHDLRRVAEMKEVRGATSERQPFRGPSLAQSSYIQ
jgi:transposase-like protein